VSHEFHRYGLRHAGADDVADGGAPAALNGRLAAGRAPSTAEVVDVPGGSRRGGEHPLDDDARCILDRRDALALRLEELLEGGQYFEGRGVRPSPFFVSARATGCSERPSWRLENGLRPAGHRPPCPLRSVTCWRCSP
jgi:hypothetical protein